MQQIELKITARSPLAIGQRKPGGSVSEALDYIPGTVLRGAIAKEILKRSDGPPETGDEFYQLFLDETTAAIFQNGYSAIAKTSTETYEEITAPIRVIPATALSSKNKSGFKSSGDPGEYSGVFDSLIDSYCAKVRHHCYSPNDLKGNAVDSFSGFYSKSEIGYYKHTLRKRLLTRVGINRRRATAEDEILYSVEVMDESQGKAESVPTVFRSNILVRGTDELANNLKAFIAQHCTELRIGGSVSRGLGCVEIEIVEPKRTESTVDTTQDTTNSVQERVSTFKNQLSTRWQLWNALVDIQADPTDTRVFFALTFQSDAILNEQWRRTMVLSAEMLTAQIGIEDIQLESAHSSYDYRSGWNAAWGLPKDTELVTQMGSVMLFSVPKALEKKLYVALETLEIDGVGTRCSEGYGQVRVCDELHNMIREEAV